MQNSTMTLIDIIFVLCSYFIEILIADMVRCFSLIKISYTLVFNEASTYEKSNVKLFTSLTLVLMQETIISLSRLNKQHWL